MRLFNSEVGNHSREYTQGNLGQNVSDINTSMFPVALLTLGKLTYMKKKTVVYMYNSVMKEERYLPSIWKWMEQVLLGELSCVQKDKEHIFCHLQSSSVI